MGTFTYNESEFLLNGKPFQILSGSIHYFRQVPEYWCDRLEKLKQCGFNTVETYVCWNLHERKEGVFDFSGRLDLGKFIDIANELGLLCIIRPGPYICAEWDYGGLPSWLLTYPNMRIRCMDQLFLEKEKRFLDKVFEIVRPRQITKGGNVIMLQVENEYGSYGNDHNYINHLADYYVEQGIDVPLFTSDGPSDFFFGGGTVEKLLKTGNFGSHWKESFGYIKQRCPNQPLMCSEFWEGWFDSWYGPHHRRTPDDVAEQLDGMLSAGGNVNFYMFCGGTNFGFTNGANMYDKYTVTTTSYDYDAALTESGDLTKRFFEVRAVAEKHFGKLPELTVKNSEKKAYGKLALSEYSPLLSNVSVLSSPIESPFAKSFEELGTDFGFVLYSTVIDYPVTEKLIIDPLRDRAHIFINGEFKGIKERDRRDDEIIIDCKVGEALKIDILIENLGRINYGNDMAGEAKGITGNARIGQQILFGWKMYPLPMDDLSSLDFAPVSESHVNCPAFFRGTLEISGDPCDTFLKTSGFEKGFVTVNGFNIGRYWNSAGPQNTLYVPAPLLKEGKNEIIVCELDNCNAPQIEFFDAPDLG
ncbi:MAG: beta-galactosidase [Clostridia bacterium]|nr:beta-galactosidase [Clostridia bacterium]